jgi:HlyD family secretion protein
MTSIKTPSTLDLRELTIDRSLGPAAEIAPNRNWFSRYVLPVGLLAGFGFLLIASVGPQLLPRKSVSVMPVMTKRVSVQRPGAVLFQAPGWIEPRPSAFTVTALTSGILDELYVVAGESVEKGQVLGRLNETDLTLQVEHHRNLISIRQAEVTRAVAEHEAAVARWQEPLHLEAALADAETELAKTRTQLSQLPFLIEAAHAKQRFAKQNWEAKEGTQGSVAQRTIDLAHQDFLTATSEFKELERRVESLKMEMEALQKKQRVLTKQLDLRVAEQQQMKEAEAKLESAGALLNEAKIQLKQAELKLSRTKLFAPISGKILSVVALPGSSLGDSNLHGKSAVVEMYDPRCLQVRADIRLEDVPRLSLGQPVEIKTASTQGVIQGRLLQTTSQANVQRNTLEVKVELLDPPETVKPEMLVTATFLAAEMSDSMPEADREQNDMLLLPNQLIQNDGNSNYVWIVDADHRSQKQNVEIGLRLDSNLVEITSGLKITDKIVVSGHESLSPGSRVVVTGEDRSFGMNQEPQRR